MKAAGLKAIDTVVSSSAVLIKSKNPSNPELVELIASRIRGVISKPSIHIHPSYPPILLLTFNPSSRAKIRPMSIQRKTHQSQSRHFNHTRKAGSYYHDAG